jgi:hypothetical protein
MTEAMVIEYEITKEDLAAFNLYHQFQSPTARRHYVRAWIFPAAAWLILCTGIWYLADRERGRPFRTFLDLLPLFSGVPLYLLYFPWAYRRKVRKIIAGMVNEGENRGVLGRHQVRISPEGIRESGELSEASTAWRAIERVVRDGEYAFIYTNALAAIIVPRRAFGSLEEFEQFVRAASAYHQKAAGS